MTALDCLLFELAGGFYTLHLNILPLKSVLVLSVRFFVERAAFCPTVMDTESHFLGCLMTRTKTVGVVLALALFATSSEAQTLLELLQENAVLEQADHDSPLSIQDVVDRVLTRHPGRQSALAQEASAREMIDVAKAKYYPQVSGGVSNSYEKYRSGRYSEKNLQNLDLNVQQLLYDFGKTASLVKKAEFGDLKAQARTDLVVEQLVKEASSSVVEAVRYQGFLDLARAHVQEVDQLTRLVEQRHDKGASNLSDVLQARSRLDSVQALVLDMESEYRKWLQEIELLTQLSGINAVSLAQFPVELNPSCTISQINWDRIPEVAMADMAAEEAVADMELASAEEWPTLSLQANASHALNATPSYGSRVETGVRLNFSMPFYQGGGLSASKRAASGALRAASAEKSQIRLQVQQRLADQVNRYQGLERRKSLLLNRVVNLNGTKDLYRKQYLDLGTRSLVDLLNAEQEYHQARVEVLNSELDLKALQIECAYSQGLLSAGFNVPVLN